MDKTRIDKWLWSARFFKTRSMAVDAINRGQVHIEGKDVKPAREIKVGDTLDIWQADIRKTVVILGTCEQRGPAPVAQTLYAETLQSLSLRLTAQEQRRLAPEPAHTITHGRPTKRDRRALQKPWNSN